MKSRAAKKYLIAVGVGLMAWAPSYPYGFTFAGVSIRAIEVRLDAKADSASSSPKMCVQVSWDEAITQSDVLLADQSAEHHRAQQSRRFGIEERDGEVTCLKWPPSRGVRLLQ